MATPLRVLILEDQPADAELMVDELRRAGFNPDWRRVDTEADYLTHLDPALDVILADYTLPQFDAARALQGLQERGLDIPFIVVTGTVGEEPAVACMRDGAADYLLKDRMARLGLAVAHALEEKRVRREKDRLAREEATRRQQLEAVRAVTVEITRELDLHTLLELITRRAAELVGAASGVLFLWDEAAQVLIPASWHGFAPWVGEIRLKLGEGLAGTLAQRRQGMLVDDYRALPFALPAFAEGSAIRAVVGEPLLYRDRLVGIITVNHEEAGKRFAEADRGLLTLFGAQAAIAIENARLYEDSQRRARQLARLNETARKLSTVLDSQKVAQEILLAVQALFPGSAGRLWEWDAEEGTFRLVANFGLKDPFGAARRLLPGQGLPGIAASTRQPVTSRDVRQDPHTVDWAWAAAEGLVSALCLPLLYGETCNGALTLLTRSPHDFTPEEVDILQAFAGQAAIALENARLYGQAQRRAQEIAALHEASQAITGSLDLRTTLDQIAENARRLAGADRALIWLVDPADGSLQAATALGPGTEAFLGVRLPAHSPSASARAVREGCPIAVPDALDPSAADPALSVRPDNAALLAVPFGVRGAIQGVLVAGYNQPRPFAATEVDRLAGLAQHAAIALENARLYEDSQRRAREATALAEVGRALSESLDIEDVLNRLVEEMRRALGVPSVGFMTLDEQTQELTYVKVAGLDSELMGRVRLKMGEGIVGRAVTQGATLQSANLLEDPRTVNRAVVEAQGLRSLLCAPLVARGRPFGGLVIFRHDVHEFTPAEVQLLVRFADQAATALENAHLYKEVKDARDFLQSIATNSTDAIVTTDLEGRITFFSPGAEDMLGYRGQEILGRLGAELYREGAEEARAITERLAAEGQIRNYETALRAKDGRLADVSASISPLCDARGAVVGRLAVARDITDRKRAEEEARRRLRMIEAFFTQAVSCLVLLDPEYDFIRVNEAYATVCRRKVEDFPGRNHFDLYPSDTKVIFDEVVRTKKSFQVLARPFTFPDQPERGVTYWDWTLQPILDDRGELEFLLFSLNEVTERTRAEEEVRKLTRAVEQSPSSIVITDGAGNIEYVNPKFTEITGYTSAEALGKNPRILKSGDTPPEEYKRLWDTITAGREWRGQLHNKKKDGTLFWEAASISSIKNHEGRITHFVAVKEDITERKQAEEQLRQSEKLATMGELLAGVAHELNNPLSVIMGQATLLGMKAEGGPLAEKAQKIGEAAERCGRIVKNFLTLARRRPPERDTVWLNPLVQETVELLAYTLRVDNVRVTLDLSPNLPVLWADPHQLQQVLVNLITNAHHAMLATAERGLTLTTRFDPARQRVALAVADTGPGIPAEIQARIFEPFFTTKPPGEGTGLGLSLCQGIVEGHGGTVTVESQPGRGATFRVELPVEAVPAPAAVVAAAAAPPPVQGKAILVVEDEPIIAELIADVLALDGQQVDVAANGVEALDRLGQRAYDLILSDLRMPDMDGPAFYQEAERRNPGLNGRFIFVTGDILRPESKAFLEQVGTPHVAKPFNPEHLRQVVQEALRRG